MKNDQLLIHFDEERCNEQINELQSFILFFTAAITEFDYLAIGKFTQENFNDLFTNPKDFLFKNIMRDKVLEVSGLKVNKEKFFDLLEKPENYYPLISRIESLESKIKSLNDKVYSGHSISYFLTLFEFNEAGKIELKWDVKRAIKKQNEIYVSNEDAKQMFKLAVELSDLLNKSAIAHKRIQAPFYVIGNWLRHLIPFNVEAKKWEVSIKYIKNQDNLINEIPDPYAKP